MAGLAFLRQLAVWAAMVLAFLRTAAVTGHCQMKAPLIKP